MKKTRKLIGTTILILVSAMVSGARAGQPPSGEEFKGLLPPHAILLTQASYDLRQTGAPDHLVYYLAGKTWGMAVISRENTLLFKYEKTNVDHLYFQGKQNPGVVFLDEVTKKPFLVYNNYSDAIHSEYHIFRWAGTSFEEVNHPRWGDNPQVQELDNQVVVVTDNFGNGVPSVYQYRQGGVVEANRDFPFFFEATVKEAWKSLEDPVLGILPGAMAAKAAYLPAFLYSGKESDGLQYADRLLHSGPSELTASVSAGIHMGKGNLLMAMGKEEEGLNEFQLADRLEHGAKSADGAGAFIKMALYFESQGDLHREALAYEKALDRLGQRDRAQAGLLREKVSRLLEIMDAKGVKESQGAQIDLGHPLTVTTSRRGGIQ